MALFCPHHPHADLIEDHRAGDTICPECGLVVGDRVIDVGTEWRSFSDERSGADPSRVGAPENPLLGGADLSTTIAVGFGSSEGDKSLANAQRRGGNNADRQMTKGMCQIREMSDRIHLARTIQDSAFRVFRQMLDGGALKGSGVAAQAASCLYIACRRERVPRTIREIIAVSGCSEREIKRCYKKCEPLIRAAQANVGAITPEDLMSRFCSNLGIPYQVQAAATHIARKCRELSLVDGRSPRSIAAAAIFMASQASRTKKTAREIGEIAGAAEATVKQVYRLMRPEATRLFPEDFNFATSANLLPY